MPDVIILIVKMSVLMLFIFFLDDLKINLTI